MSLFGDIGGLIGAEDAEDAQYAAAQARIAALNQGYDRAKEVLDPSLKFGNAGMGVLSRLYGFDDGTPDMSAFTASPGYQFRVGEGTKAIESSAAARGGLFSGATAKALQNYGQSAASQEFDNYVSRLFGTTGVGQNAASGIANAATGNASQVADVWGDIGDNQADAKISQANAIGGIADQGAAAFMGGMSPSGFNYGQASRLFFGA